MKGLPIFCLNNHKRMDKVKKDKFLTVFASFDLQSQNKLKKLQNEILKLGWQGTQTMDIPFHISLGSFPVDMADELIERIKKVCLSQKKFDIFLGEIGDFSDKVLFIQPIVNENLLEIQKEFQGNYADGYPWHAHTTIFCGNENEVRNAKEKLSEIFKPIVAEVQFLELGEFFPTKMIYKGELNKK